MNLIWKDYPPHLSNHHLESLIKNAIDWQYMHGSLLKIPPDSDEILAHPIGISLFPTPFPKMLFEDAHALQVLYNKLYARVACDEEWLFQCLRNLSRSNALVRSLWDVHRQVKELGYIQDLSLGLFRSDYMMHSCVSENGQSQLQLKQVELNTYSVAGGVHSARITKLHKLLQKTGSYGLSSPRISPSSLPDNPATDSLASGLLRAHFAYGPPKSNLASRTGILFIVQSNNVNICDERPLEELLWDHDLPTYRLEFNHEILDATSLTTTRELLFHGSLSHDPLEISVVYMRAGYDEHEYRDQVGIAARVRLESSRAIKCPSLLSHLTTFKKVQQELSTPGMLERFLSAPEAAKLSKTFMPMYPLDSISSLGQHGRALALDPTTAAGHILKPSLEGGGHNVYGAAIPEFLRMIPEDSWSDHILMEQIEAPEIRNSLISSHGLHSGPVVTELGVFGVCLWSHADQKEAKIMENKEAGFSLKTKSREMDEISVVKGYGCFDSPLLV